MGNGLEPTKEVFTDEELWQYTSLHPINKTLKIYITALQPYN